VRALDALLEQVHGPSRTRPAYLADGVDLRIGDVRHAPTLKEALVGVDAVLHLAAAVGVGQSMYEVANYTSVNSHGTAVLLDVLATRDVGRLVVASSMSIYGEGRYVADDGTIHDGVERSRDQLERGRWDPADEDGALLRPVGTPEDKRPILSSIYALTKYDQERMCLIAGRAYRRSTLALRFFNTYGPRQALSNPYTGVLAIFAARLLNGRSPLVFEDGEQQRDFVSVHDVARACCLALERPEVDGEALNIGSGEPRTVSAVASLLSEVLDVDLEPELTGKYRMGDIRHCYADVRRAEEHLGWAPQVSLEDGVAELGRWLAGQQAEDRTGQMRSELERRGLTL
jgi:dTDP-L-rhamnose 4-epimerase